MIENSSTSDPELPDDTAQASSRRGYRLFAPLYDLVFGFSLNHGRKLAIAALDIRPGDRILEVGVGSGMALPLYPGYASITGIDLSDEMLARARRKVRQRKLNQVKMLLQMDVERLSFRDGSFDKAVMMYTVSGFPDPALAMAEVQRVCKPGATLVIANHFLSERPLMRVFDILLAPLFRLLRYRADLAADAFIAASGLEVLDREPANLFGYSTVLVCRSRGAAGLPPRPMAEQIDLDDAESSPISD